MQIVSRKWIRSVSRELIFFCVLAALLFSCGEGIRLFPFPSEIIENADVASSDKRVSYQENVQRIEKKQENYQSGSHRDKKHHRSAGGNFGWNFSPFSDLVVSNKTDIEPGARFFRSRQVRIPLSGRAPPVS
jgi:hypothetical protein